MKVDLLNKEGELDSSKVHKAVNYIADYYGKEAQCLKAIEELNELSRALARYLYDDKNKEKQEDLKGELADVIIMVLQLVHLVECKHIADIIASKIDRQFYRIDKEKRQYKNEMNKGINMIKKELDSIVDDLSSIFE